MADLEKRVLVQLNRADNSLTITPKNVQVGHREWVRWEFIGLSESEFGFISFAPPNPRLGPFYSLRSFTSDSVLGKGNKGATGSFDYTALVLDPSQENAVASATAIVESTTNTVNTSPEIYVTYRDKNTPLAVSPDPVGLHPGDTATWRFRNLPPDTFACFQFQLAGPGMKKESGPFLAFSALNGEAPVTVEASGMGFAASFPDVRQFTYHIELRYWDGRLLASHDPVIDNLGVPPESP